MKTKISLIAIIAATALSLSGTATAQNTMRFGATVGPDLALNANASENSSGEADKEPNICTPEQRVVTRAQLNVLIANNDPAISDVCTSQITNFTDLFRDNTVFNQDISRWVTSNVTDMRYMFYSSRFNGDISNWDTSKVTTMSGMFFRSPFNGDISNWDTSNVTQMDYMFHSSKFNGDISNWDTSNVTMMNYMFFSSPFNGDISNWDTSNVTMMNYMFFNSTFNGDISNWDTSNVIYMNYMFSNSKFNGDISNWNVSNVNQWSGFNNDSELSQENIPLKFR
ncbi:DUF285 domain-containing protein [Pseudoalteromonas sp. OFAV1]|uniref:BspA family leucine-rich repeat surface protein n=1 Tax=Pseudoalteromonas sp. OFAV1 TaxID=2908892 RepID=UPI001F459D78|nr:BspA family leucine-rich repeat surface protein [Pseudoalteromonas sp. OFAV1]MCF2901163.1 DUF285 domain-containing protein [Pseudoalteromonas sp. OFAV1]